MSIWLRDCGLTLTLLGFFAASLVAQSVAGMRGDNQDQREHNEPSIGYGSVVLPSRAVKRYPPRDRDYLTPQEARGDPPEHLSQDQRASWDTPSFYGTERGVRQQAREVPHIGKFIVRYDIPEDAGITVTPSLGPGHYEIRGDKETLKRCLTDYVVPI